MLAHLLEHNGFVTSCGLNRHFGSGVQPHIASSVSKVTCPQCKESKRYKSEYEALQRELRTK